MVNPKRHLGDVPWMAMVYRSAGSGCPLCGIRLKKVEVGQRRFDRCPSCLGVWIKTEVLAEMLAEMTIGSLVAAPVQTPAAEPERRCCFCSEVMEKRVLFDVLVDACHHGVWLDPTELEAMLATAGGVEFEDEQTTARRSADRSLLAEIFG